MLWGLGVGYVISGEYFGWNLGLAAGGTFGLLAAFVLITVMYVTFVLSYTEMACAIPRAGGVFVYGVRGLGLVGGYLGGIAQVVEFVFAPPAIAVAIGAYAQFWLPVEFREQIAANLPWGLDARHAIAAVSYVLFTALNIWGVRQAALFELAVTILAVAELLLFTGVAAPHFEWSNLTANALPNGWWGVLPAIPFAIWFYLAIEGVANAAEEAKNPQRDVARGFGTAMFTLVVLAACVLICGVGVGGWEQIVYKAQDVTTSADGSIVVAAAAEPQDTPLPLALGQIVRPGHWLYKILIGVGLLGLVASFNGIILVAGRALFEMGRVGFLPHMIGRANATTKTPLNALLLNLAVGIVAVLFLDTGGLITMSALGAVTLYMVSMLALLRLRVREPDLPRPYRTPCYPIFPLVTLAIATFALVTMLYFNLNLADVEAWWRGEGALGEFLRGAITLWYLGFIVGAFVYYLLVVRRRLDWDDIAHFHRLD
jgi:ethanolamine permease